MWLPGATAGSLWSLGNVGSIVAVEHLGQGVGYSASQAALLIRYYTMLQFSFDNNFECRISFVVLPVLTFSSLKLSPI